MQSEIEINADLDEPLQRGRLDDEEEPDLEQRLMRAAEFEFRESPVTTPGDPLA